jgi:DNA replication and repair protein RecF
MDIARLEITQFRNLSTARVEPEPGFNIFYGLNGSGKTSLLEAIYFLGLGRSFRSHLLSRIIQHNTQSFSLFSSLIAANGQSIAIGIEKQQSNKTKIKIGGAVVDSSAELARLLPIQLINIDTFQLINAGPKYRRQFIDWGVFHVEHNFFSSWKKMQRALKQRNAALRSQQPVEQVVAWNEEFVIASLEVEQLRQTYFEQLTPVFLELLAQLIDMPNLSITYSQGWDGERHLREILAGGIHRDYQLGYTQYGPQRSDVVIKIDNVLAEEVLSRGEQKLVVCALRLAQGILLRKLTEKRCVYLVDDLPSELDKRRCSSVLAALEKLQAQVFLTCVGVDNIEAEGKRFHVEQGEIL